METNETAPGRATSPRLGSGLMRSGPLLGLGAAALVAFAAGAADAAGPGHPGYPSTQDAVECPDPAGTTAEEQRACGEELYRQICWECHEEDDGSGTILDPDLLASYNNAWAVYDYVSYSMPEDDPGILPEADYWAVTAYLLDSRDLLPADAVLTAETAEGIELEN